MKTCYYSQQNTWFYMFNERGDSLLPKTVVPKKTKIINSIYLLEQSKVVIRETDIKQQTDDDFWVICPTYFVEGKMSGCQFSVTGSLAKNPEGLLESPDDATIREISEEIGITCDKSDLESYGIKYFNGKTIHNFGLRVSNSKPYEKIDGCISSFTQDDKTKKIQIIMYGTLPEIHTLLECIVFREESIDKANIRGIRVLPFNDIKKYFNI